MDYDCYFLGNFTAIDFQSITGDLMPLELMADRLKLIQQISPKLIWKNYFYRLRHGRVKYHMINAHIHLEKGDYTIE